MVRNVVALGAPSLVLALFFGCPARASAAEDDLTLDLGGAPLELRRIPKGTFVQGLPPTEAGREADEMQRSVTITRAFWLGKVPVTRAQFSRFVSETHHVTDAEKGQSGGFGWDAKTGALAQKKEFTWRNPGFAQKDDEPVVLVAFGDANAFVTWASRKTGRRVRLPTEAEWEYAARGGTSTPWYAASKEEEAMALGWFKPNGASQTHSVGLKKPNAFGLFDMSGNVFEWCRDVYAPYLPGEAVDPDNTANAGSDPERRVLRGGSWARDPKRSRSAARYRNTPGSRNADNGFRVAVDPEVPLALVPSSALPMPSALLAGADASASAAPPISRSTDGTSWTLIAAPAAAAGAVIAWVLARRKRTPPDARGIGTRAQEDGFWIRARGLPAGTRCRYACILNGVEVSDVVPLDGGDETFVYTGARPSAIRITEVVEAEVQAYRAALGTPSASSQGIPSMITGPASVTGPAAPRASSPSDLGIGGIVPPVTPLPSSPRQVIVPVDDDSPFAGYPRAY